MCLKLPHHALCIALALASLGCLTASVTLNASQLDLDERLDLALTEAPLDVVLQSMGQILGAELELDPAVQGKVTLDVKSQPWQEVLDGLCKQHRLSCEVIPNQPPLLRVRPTSALPGYHLEPGLVDLIDISLKRADLVPTLESFGVIAGRQVVIDPQVSGHVTLNLRRTPWPLAAQLACELNRCQIEWGETLVVRPLAPGLSPPRFRLVLQGAQRSEALRVAADLPSFVPFGPLHVEGTEDVSGIVDIDLNEATSVEVLNALCSAPECRWELVYGSISVLRIHGPESKAQNPMALHPPRGQEPIAVTLQAFDSEQAADSTVTLEPWSLDFTWRTPHQALALSPATDLVLSWLPFSPEKHFLLPVLQRCEGRARSRLLEAITLPLIRPEERRADDLTLRFTSTTEDLPSTAVRAPQCLEVSKGRLLAKIAPTSTESHQQEAATDRPAAEPTHLSLAAQPGSYVLVRGTAMERAQQAVVILPSNTPDESLDVVVARLDDGQLSTQTIRLQAEAPEQMVSSHPGDLHQLSLAYHLHEGSAP